MRRISKMYCFGSLQNSISSDIATFLIIRLYVIHSEIPLINNSRIHRRESWRRHEAEKRIKRLLERFTTSRISSKTNFSRSDFLIECNSVRMVLAKNADVETFLEWRGIIRIGIMEKANFTISHRGFLFFDEDIA